LGAAPSSSRNSIILCFDRFLILCRLAGVAVRRQCASIVIRSSQGSVIALSAIESILPPFGSHFGGGFGASAEIAASSENSNIFGDFNIASLDRARTAVPRCQRRVAIVIRAR